MTAKPPTQPIDEPADATSNVSSQGATVAGLTGLSRVSGLVRDVVLAQVIGASGTADAFFLCFALPNFFRRLFAEGAFAQAFVPVLADYIEKKDEDALQRFVAAMAGNLGLALLVVSAAGVAGAAGLVAVFMQGFANDPAQFALAVDLARIVFPYLGLISLTAFAGAVLNASNRYAVPAFTPVLLNVSLVCAALWAVAVGSEAVYALAWGVLVAGVAQLALQTPSLARLGLLVAPRPDWRHPGAKRVGQLLVPAVLAASAGQVNALVGMVLASYLEAGSRSWLYYADRLMELPIGVVAIAIGTVLLPNLSRLHHAKRPGDFSTTLDWGLRLGLLLGVPASAALAVLADPLVATIYLHGEMRVYDAEMTSAALRVFAIGLVPLVLVKVAAPGYFAREDTRTPFRFAVAAVIVNVVLSLATFQWLGHIGLALANSVAAFVNAGLLVGVLLGQRHYRPTRKTAVTLVATVVGSAIMAMALWYFVPPPSWWFDASLLHRIGALTVAVLGGIGIYAAVTFAAGVRPADLLHRT